MTRGRALRNVPASVKARLLNLARSRELDFNLLLDQYAVERFLYRLSISGEVDRFMLKGATLFRIWLEQELRPTRDVDLLTRNDSGRPAVQTSLERVCGTSCPEDGVTFDPGTIQIREMARIQETTNEQTQAPLRAQLRGHLGVVRLGLQVDIGFGDAVTPRPVQRDYPTLLDLPAPRLWTYPREAMIAEKFNAMVSHGADNTREKDLWDIACLARFFAFDGETLQAAIAETFRQRHTPLAGERPIALMSGYYLDAARTQRWQALQQQMDESADGPVRLVDVGEELRRFLGPVCDSLIDGSPFTLVWAAGGPWTPSTTASTGEEGP